MCTRRNLQNYMIALVLIKVVQMIYIFSFGVIITIDVHLHQAYGNYIKQIGIGLIITAIIGSMNMFTGVHGSRCHNKFLLLVYSIVDLIIFLVLTILGQRLVRAATPLFDSNVRYNCARHTPKNINDDNDKDYNCREYLHHDRTSGFRLVWISYATRSVKDASYYKRIMDIQVEGSCCGLGPPKRCTPDRNPYNDRFPLSDIPLEYATERQVCAKEEFWYPPTDTCNYNQSEWTSLNKNNNSTSTTVGGCMYDMALGGCQNVDVGASTTGCLAALEDKIGAAIEPPSQVLLGMSSIQAVAFVASCCLFWKRKREDVLPNMEYFKNRDKRR
mmetsp:Transcript_26582/g.39156  ORF Transcript_26582/g.39156 Transcript_26582/m.39156 type:complete len:330 (+) Transcript_26582:273-1262(+)